MNEKEKTVLQKVHLSLLSDLSAKDISPYLFQYGMITEEEYEDIEELNETRKKKCQKLLRFITRQNSKCTFEGFVQALRYNDAYSFLAERLEQTLEKVLQTETDPSGDRTEENVAEFPSQEKHENSDILYEPMRKINVFTKGRKTMSVLAHKLKRLSHDGDMDGFQRVVKAIDTKFRKNKLNGKKNIRDRMELADMRFTSLEAEISAKRVRYDKSVGEGDAFRYMESVIPFTSNPRVSSMTYLARYGSAVAMKNSIDDGLTYVQFAKEHAEYVTPCKDTGMVYYIEVNLLSQKYEKDPTQCLKTTILRTSEQGIAQFNSENDEIRKDYQRMLLLKMVFCYLGVGLFCKKIEKAQTTSSERDEAKKVIDFIETPDVWQGMEKRRKMLFYVAKSEYYKQQGNMDLAKVHAKEAEKLGKENSWMAELPNICDMLMELEKSSSSNSENADSKTADDILSELFEELSDNEENSEDGNTDNSGAFALDNEGVKGHLCQCDLHLQTLPENGKETPHMMVLKEVSYGANIDEFVGFSNCQRIAHFKEQSGRNETGTVDFDTVTCWKKEATGNKCTQNENSEKTNSVAMENLKCTPIQETGDSDSNFTVEGTEMACLKCSHEIRDTKEETLLDVDTTTFTNNQHLRVLKEQPFDNDEACYSNFDLMLLKEDGSFSSQLQKCDTLLSSYEESIPPPML